MKELTCPSIGPVLFDWVLVVGVEVPRVQPLVAAVIPLVGAAGLLAQRLVPVVPVVVARSVAPVWDSIVCHELSQREKLAP